MQPWVTLSLMTMGILVLLDFAYKFLIQEGYTPMELTLYPMVLGLLVGIVYVAGARRDSLRLPKNARDVLVFGAVGVFFFIAFLTIRYAQHAAPNLGYVNAIVYSSVLFTIVGTSVVMGSALSAQALLGSVLVISGISLITWKSSATSR